MSIDIIYDMSPELAVTGAVSSSGDMLAYVPFREKDVGREITLYHRTNSPFSADAEILAKMIGGCVRSAKGKSE